MSTDSQHSTSPASDTKTDTVSWLGLPLKYIMRFRLAAGDYYMDEIKPVLESHIYVLAILSTRDTDLSAYIADVQSACNVCVFSLRRVLCSNSLRYSTPSYDEALKAEQNIKLLLLRRAPANLPIARIAQTYASTAHRVNGIVKVC